MTVLSPRVDVKRSVLACLLGLCGCGGGNESAPPLSPAPTPAPEFTLAVAVAGQGSVVSTPAGISCGATCSATFVAGTSVNLTAAGSPGYTFSGWSGSGCMGTGACVVPIAAATNVTATFVATVAAARYAFAANDFGNGHLGSVSAFSVDAGGKLNLLAIYPSDTMSTVAVTLDPSAHHLFVLGKLTSKAAVLAYDIDAATGALTPVAGSPFLTNVEGGSLAFSINPQGTRLYLDQTEGVVSAFSIDPVSGVLSALPNTPVSNPGGFAEANLRSSSFGANGSVLYLSSPSEDHALAVDPNTGSLTEVAGSPFGVDASVAAIFEVTADPVGGFVYEGIVEGTSYALIGFVVDPVTGGLTPMSGAAPLAGAPQGAFGPFLAVEPSGRFLYAAVAGGVSTYSIAPSGGTLALVAGPNSTGVSASNVVVDPGGQWVFAGGQGHVSAFSIDQSTGILSPIMGSPYDTGVSAPAQPLLVNGFAVSR